MNRNRFVIYCVSAILALVGIAADQASAQLDSGLTHLWNFENNLDDMVGGLDGTAAGTTAFGTGKVGGNSIELTGTGYVDVDTPVITDGQAQYTYAAWYKVAGAGGTILETAHLQRFPMSAHAGPDYFFGIIGTTGAYRSNAFDVSNDNEWKLVVVTYDGSLSDATAGTVFINGVYVGNLSSFYGSGDITPLPAGGNGLHIGVGKDGNNGRFSGLIDEVAIWDRTLSATEVAELYNGGNGINLTELNTAPTAVAGENQSIRAGDDVTLDGSASFDDNTATPLLDFAWSLVSKPATSSAILDDSTSVMPSFTADAAGTYVLELVVTDEGELTSEPAFVEISSDNLAPIAIATSDVSLSIIGNVIALDGTSSVDPEGDAITYQWSIASAPAGSTAGLVGSDGGTPTLTPDIEGTYVVSLEVSDFLGAGTPVEIELTATLAVEFAEIVIVQACDQVTALGAAEVTTRGNQRALCNFLNQAVRHIQNGRTDKAIDKLNNAVERTDGWALRGAADGNGKGRDWVTDEIAQTDIYELLTLAIDAIE